MTHNKLLRHQLLFACLSLGLVACGDSSEGDTSDCSPGSANCPCAQGLCLQGLVCQLNLCVPAQATMSDPTNDPTMSDPSGDPSTSGDPPTSDPTMDPTVDPPTTDGPDSEGNEAGGPQILQFLTNVNHITEGESVIFTAVVTDPDGVADVIGGSLTSPDGKIAYGAFVTSGEEGAYSLTLQWAAIQQADDITFETPSLARTFRAEFFDQGGKSAWKTADIELTCDDGLRVTPAACAGTCTDLDSDNDHCTRCDVACDVYSEFYEIGICENSACKPTLAGCLPINDDTTCTAYCASIGETCVVAGCGGGTSWQAYADDCEPSVNDNSNYDHPCGDVPDHPARCCCTQTI